jgi:hypothetical protein
MSDRTPTRRTLLRSCGVGAAVGLAGCLWGNSDDGQNGDENDDTPVDDGTDTPTSTPTATPTPGENGDESIEYADAFELAGGGTEPFRDWVVPDNPLSAVNGVTGVCAYLDFEIAAEQEISAWTQYRSGLANEYGIESESITGELTVGEPEGTGTRLIQFGDFPADTIIANFKEQSTKSRVDEYRGYTVFEQQDGNRIVVGSDAVIRVPIYRQYIDASKGDGERLTESDEDVRDLFAVLPSGLQISVSRHENLEDLAINGSTRHDLTEDNSPNRTTRAFVFHDEAAATVERAREIISSGNSDFEEILTEESHGRMVMTEFIADW